jgi:hypothetical protein
MFASDLVARRTPTPKTVFASSEAWDIRQRSWLRGVLYEIASRRGRYVVFGLRTATIDTLLEPQELPGCAFRRRALARRPALSPPELCARLRACRTPTIPNSSPS